MTPHLLFSWRDVRDLLRSSDQDLSDLDVELDLYGLRVFSEDKDKALQSLASVFGAAFDPSGPCIELVSVNGERRTLPVESLPLTEFMRPPQVERPLWSGPPLSAPPSRGADACSIAAFFSFKGGVGRTLTCFATLVELLQRSGSKRVLYIDADVEAPGLSWLLPPISSERFSWIDALSVLHDSEDWRTEALPLIVERIKLSTADLELSSGRRSFFVLPAIRSFSQIEELPITPEQVVRRRGRAWVIGDLLDALAKELNLDAILVDLRAGITEFSSPVMLDPRVKSVLVTSCAEQSVRGTERAFELVSARATWIPELDVVVTKVPRDGDARFDTVSRRMEKAWSESGESEEESPPRIFRVDFSDALLPFDDLQAVAEQLSSTPLHSVAVALSERIVERVSAPIEVPDADLLTKIAELAEQIEFAEGYARQRLLPSPPLRQLTRTAAGALPGAVVLGAKGAGKTFAWGQMVLAGRWEVFCEAVGEEGREEALVFPLLIPANLRPPMQQKVSEAESAVHEQLGVGLGFGTGEPMSAWEMVKQIHGGIPADGDELTFWTSVIAARLGLPMDAGHSPRSLANALEERNCRVVLAVDGLEDALQVGPNSPMEPSQMRVLRALLIELISELNALGVRHLGLVVFIRRDLAQSAIPQNFGQFEARHRSVALKWSPNDALRLTLWLLREAGWLFELPDVLNAPRDELASALHPFWGEKMGGARDAYTDRWVIAALSDLNGNFQARDLIRLLAEATRGARSLPLGPADLRNAILPCSRKKIEELQIEVQQLIGVFTKMRQIAHSEGTVPLRGDLLPLDDAETEFLLELGILYFDEKEQLYYLPEIIRQGLGFRLARRGRARVVSLLRAASRRQR